MDMQGKAELIYRTILVILFIVFLAILYQYSQNGRYIYIPGDNLAALDSRTGTLYAISAGKAVKAELPLGKFTTSPIQPNTPSPK